MKLKNHHIRRLVFSQEAPTAEKLPENVIQLGAADIHATEPRSNPDTDPGTEFTMLGCVTAGRSILANTEAEKGYFLNLVKELVQMCSQEVLGLVDGVNPGTVR